METKLERIAEVAKSKPKEKFTSLIHLINKETITQSHKEMKTNKASGVDMELSISVQSKVARNYP